MNKYAKEFGYLGGIISFHGIGYCFKKYMDNNNLQKYRDRFELTYNYTSSSYPIELSFISASSIFSIYALYRLPEPKKDIKLPGYFARGMLLPIKLFLPISFLVISARCLYNMYNNTEYNKYIGIVIKKEE